MTPLSQLIEAALYSAARPLTIEELATLEPEVTLADVRTALEQLKEALDFGQHGVELVELAGGWQILTRPALAAAIERAQFAVRTPRLTPAALETLAIIAYRQPVGRAEIEEIRGVATSRGTLDVLLETGWVRLRGRRRTPGRPVTFGVTEAFLSHFGLDSVGDLPGVEELKAAGLLDSRVPANFAVPEPRDLAALTEDEDPLEEGDTGE